MLCLVSLVLHEPCEEGSECTQQAGPCLLWNERRRPLETPVVDTLFVPSPKSSSSPTPICTLTTDKQSRARFVLLRATEKVKLHN